MHGPNASPAVSGGAGRFSCADKQKIVSFGPSDNIDFAMARCYLASLDPDANAFTFQVFADRGSNRPALSHGTLQELSAKLIWLNRGGCGILVAVNATDLKGRKLANITHVRAVWQEDDAGFKGTFPIAPSMVVQSSPGKFNRYGVCDGLTAEQHQAVMARLVSDYGSDKNAKDLTRVLRVPGFFH